MLRPFRRVALTTVVLLLFSVPALLLSSDPAFAQDIVAVVNDDVITNRDADQRLRLALLLTGQAPTEANAARLRPQVVRALVDEKLQLQEAARLGVEAPEGAVEEEVARLAERNNLSVAQIDTILTRAGVEPATLRQQIRTQIVWSLVARRELLPRAVVSDTQVAQTLSRTGATEYRLAELFLPVYAADQEQRVLQDAQRLREAVAAGADFGALAEQFSTAPSAERRGDLGWLAAEALPQELRRVVQGLGDGDVSQPVRTPEGVYLFLRTGRREVEGDLRVWLRRVDLVAGDSVGGEPIATFVERARNDAPSCPALDTLAAGIEDVRVTSLDDVAPASLPGTLATVAVTQPVGVVSDPVRTAEGTTLVMVCSRTGGADADDRQQVVDQLRMEALDRLASRYLRNLRQDAFIDLRAQPG